MDDIRKLYNYLLGPLMTEQSIEKGLLRRSTHVASTITEEHDRYGDGIGVNIYAVRVGQMAIVITYHPSEDEDEYHLEVDCVGPISELKDMVKRVHDSYYEGYTCGFYVKNDLKDKLPSVSKYLDKLYVPTEGVEATLPSEILSEIVTKSLVERPPKWAWFDDILFLTASVRRRYGQFNSAWFFDNSIKTIFRDMNFKVQEVEQVNYGHGVSFSESIRNSLRVMKLNELEKELESVLQFARHDIGSLNLKRNELLKCISDLERSIEQVKTGGSFEMPKEIPTIEDIGVDKYQSSKWQKLAALPEEQFEQKVDD